MNDHNPFLWNTAERQGRAHSFDMINLTLELRARVEALEVAENERRFREGSKLIEEATPEQIRAAVAPASLLVERVAWLLAKQFSESRPGTDCTPFARAALREVAAVLREVGSLTADVAARWLEQEAER
jgi:hypothetical protein